MSEESVGIQDHPIHATNPQDAKSRAKLRLNEQRRLDRACEVLEELIGKHMEDMSQAHSLHEIHVTKALLTHLIKNQHIKDVDYKRHKLQRMVPLEGDF